MTQGMIDTQTLAHVVDIVSPKAKQYNKELNRYSRMINPQAILDLDLSGSELKLFMYMIRNMNQQNLVTKKKLLDEFHRNTVANATRKLEEVGAIYYHNIDQVYMIHPHICILKRAQSAYFDLMSKWNGRKTINE